MVVLGTMSFVREVDQVEGNSGSGSVSAQFEEKGSALWALDAVPISDATSDGKVNKWNKNTLVWFPRSVSSAAPAVSAATAVVQPASGPNPTWLERWVRFEEGLTMDSMLWEWVSMEDEEVKEEKRTNLEGSLPEKEHVTDLVGSLRGQKKGRAGEEESEVHYTAAVRKTPPPQPVLFSLYEEESGNGRPASLAEPPGPQERVPQRTVEPMLDTFLPVRLSTFL